MELFIKQNKVLIKTIFYDNKLQTIQNLFQYI